MSRAGDRTKRVVEGALLSAIHDHGPITEETVQSAVKRVAAQLRSAGARQSLLMLDGGALVAYEDMHKRLQRLRHGHSRLLSTEAKLRAERDALLAALMKGWNWAQYDYARTHPEEIATPSPQAAGSGH